MVQQKDTHEVYTSGKNNLAHPPPGEEVVITGISGQFPDSDNMAEFAKNLYNKVDMVSDDDRRWKTKHPEIPQRTGKINNVSKFDANFFGVHYKQAHTMDPMCRKMMETAFEAVVDAGINPRELKGTNTGVFVGACFSESEKTWFYEKLMVNGFGITGCSRAMIANRVSYWLGIHGPSYSVDTACSSSATCIEIAYRSIRDGACEAALVGGCNLCLHPYVSLQFSRLGVLSPDGRCKSYDNNANGYARSEAIAMLLLQKSKDARRIYATVVHAKTNCDGYKDEGITYPSGKIQQKLLEDFYRECGTDASTVDYIEAHGTGTRVGDPEEARALDAVFCKNRKTVLPIGTVKSNIGHSEPASGLCSIAKVIISMESGYLVPNINLQELRKDVEPLISGRLSVITDKTKWNGGLVGVNSFGFGGANCHILLRSNTKEKDNKSYKTDNIPRLVLVSGRTAEAVERIISEVESNPLDTEFIGLLHEIFKYDIPGHIYRGYVIKTRDETVSKQCDYYTGGEKRPIWFVFSGMGSQWAGMGTGLLKIPVFAEAIEKCQKVLLPKGINVIDLITSPDEKIFDDIINCFVGICAIQIGLVDVLSAVGIFPDKIIGHSVGEVGCAYADGCFTLEQTILAAYFRGLASKETQVIRGAMAAVGAGYTQLQNLCPPTIDIACHNSFNSCTISGPENDIRNFVAQLQANGTFAKEVNTSNIAYHSRYIQAMGPTLLNYLKKVIPEPKLRSEKWMATSIPESKWGESESKYSSAQYHTNNLLSSVLFEETSKYIPSNAVTIEIAPHGLLQAILKRSLHKQTIKVSLTQRGHKDNTQYLLTTLGKLYQAGYNPYIQNLFPKVNYPVSRGTPMISPLIKWEHGEDWYVTSYQTQEKITSGERTLVFDPVDDEREFVRGHVIDGRNLFPATGYIQMVWETFAMMQGKMYLELSVVLENVRFVRATTVPKEGVIEFTIMIHKGTGIFEVIEGGTAIVTGRIFIPEDIKSEMSELPLPVKQEGSELLDLTERDIYKELRLRGYNYKGLFRSVTQCNNLGTTARIRWHTNWVAFMDNMLQLNILQEDNRGLFVPTSIQRIICDVRKHGEFVNELTDDDNTIPAYAYKEYNIIKAGGVEIRGLIASPIARRKPLGEPVLEKYVFVPNTLEKQNLEDSVRVFVQLGMENLSFIKVKVVELIDDRTATDSRPLSPIVHQVLSDLPLIQPEMLVISKEPLELNSGIKVENRKLSGENNCIFVIGTQLLARTETLQAAHSALRPGGFVISRETLDTNISNVNIPNFEILLEHSTASEKLVLLSKSLSGLKAASIIDVSATKQSFAWLSELQQTLKINPHIVLYAENDPLNGILGLVNCIRKEPGGEHVKCFFIVDTKAPAFDVENNFYKQQIDKNLAVNVYKDGKWGTYRHLLIDESKEVMAEHAYVDVLVRGDLSSLRWLQGPLTSTSSVEPDHTLINVYYAALNFRDIMTATGKLAPEVVAKGRLNQECVQGLEFSGRDTKGRRVMGMALCKALATMVSADVNYVWEVPDEWSLEDAATVPVAYGTAYMALVMIGKMQKGQTILIHSGSGGVGQAAIHLALHYGCKVFTTVGTAEKREFIKKVYPQIKDNQIGNSHSTSFEQLIMTQTDGKGVDLVLNSLAEEKLQASVRCLGQKGKFLEIGKYDLSNDNPLGMRVFLKEVSFHGVLLDNAFEAPVYIRQELHRVIEEGIKSGAVKPLTRHVFQREEIEPAFRFMASGKHLGKILISVREEETKKSTQTPIKLFSALSRLVCYPDKTYVIIGGLGGFGLELADRMVLRGARKLVLTSRTGVTTGYQALRIRLWKSYGTEVCISRANITTEEGVRELLNQASEMAPVEAIYNLAVVLRDATVENQTVENFEAVFQPKATATRILDKVSRVLCPKLKHFVTFSSVSCGRGNGGQTNYAMANSVMERICEQRRKECLPGLAIQWGAIGDVGLVAENLEDNMEIEIGGTLQQRIFSCLNTLDLLIAHADPVLSSMVVAEKQAVGSGAENMVAAVAQIMGLRDLKTISPHSTLAELGMDSMMSVEIKQMLERDFEVFLSAPDVRSMTFAKLMEIDAERQSQNDQDVVDDGSKNDYVATLFRTIGDESAAYDSVVEFKTAVKRNDDNLQVFFIPGIESCAAVFNGLAGKLNSQAYCLQTPPNLDCDSVQEMAKFCLQSMKRISTRLQDFVLVGYSFGTLVTLEMAMQLESEGKHGQVILIDGSPSMLLDIVKMNFSIDDDEICQLRLLELLSLYMRNDYSLLKVIIENEPTWETKLEAFVDSCPQDLPYSTSYIRDITAAIKKRINAVIHYAPTQKKIKSPVKLIRPKANVNGKTSPDDYCLSSFSDEEIKVFFVEGNHLTILDNISCASIINNLTKSEHVMFKEALLNKTEDFGMVNGDNKFR